MDRLGCLKVRQKGVVRRNIPQRIAADMSLQIGVGAHSVSEDALANVSYR